MATVDRGWEAGEVTPSDFYQPIIAATFGTSRTRFERR
jgi:hypothetical protein